LIDTVFDSLPLPRGVQMPIYFCGDPCKVAKSDEEDTYGQRYWMCANFAFEPMIAQCRVNLMMRIIVQTCISFHMK
jgi:hypothetical protein